MVKDPFIEKYQTKIREQASRLQKLEKYKYLCEKKILLLNPSQKMPIHEEDISQALSNNSSTIDRKQTSEREQKLVKENNTLKREIAELNKKLNVKVKVRMLHYLHYL